MEDSIIDFAKQFGYTPEIIGGDLEGLGEYKQIILGGMGGSHLSADLLKAVAPGTDIYVHKDYDLPPYDDEFFKESLLVASSYSGNTEETMSFLEAGVGRGYRVVVISTGGKLVELAQEHDLPYIQLPDTGIQPRLAVGFAAIALATLLPETTDRKKSKKTSLLADLASMETELIPDADRAFAEELAQTIDGKTPVIYASPKNLAVAYNWKIKFNETAKVPAFYNLFPELNHNEMQGFGLSEATQDFAHRFHVVFLTDENDHERTQKRMSIAQDLYEQKGITTTELKIEGKGRLHSLLKTILIADWVALTLARAHGTEPEEVPMIEEFKKRLVE
jgi:glucose/mannose-6-phosphate isomerase